MIEIILLYKHESKRCKRQENEETSPHRGIQGGPSISLQVHITFPSKAITYSLNTNGTSRPLRCINVHILFWVVVVHCARSLLMHKTSNARKQHKNAQHRGATVHVKNYHTIFLIWQKLCFQIIEQIDSIWNLQMEACSFFKYAHVIWVAVHRAGSVKPITRL